MRPSFSFSMSDSHSENMSDGDCEEGCFFVGHLKKPNETESFSLDRRYFPSKVGGKPAWLAPSGLPDINRMRCDGCGQLMTFLLQVYCPKREIEEPSAFHRHLFVFVCRRCKPNPCKVFRSQLPLHNPFFSSSPMPAGPLPLSDASTEGELSTLCCLCGIPCEEGLPSPDLSNPRHVHKECEARVAMHLQVKLPEFLVEPEEVDFEDMESDDESEGESEADEEDKDQHVEDLLNKYKADVAAGVEKLDESEEAAFEELCNDALGSSKDPFLRKFQRLASLEPGHVLYFPNYDYAEPLWLTSDPAVTDKPVPPCALCGSERQFEFQVQPQLIFRMEREARLPENVNLDFGVIAVYSCRRSCSPPDSLPYPEEYVVTQGEPEEWASKAKGAVKGEGRPATAATEGA